MTKRLTMTLVALAVFVLFAVLPASAISANPATGLYNGSVIMNGTPVPTVFIGEDQLNLTRVIYGDAFDLGGPVPAGVNTKIGWWAPGTFSFPNNPSQIVDVGPSINSFYVNPTTFGPYTGTWYCLTPLGSAISTAGVAPFGAAFIVADPSQTIAAIDVAANMGQGQDMTGKSVVRGTVLTVKVDTNLAAFTSGGRADNITNNQFNGTLTQLGPQSNFFYTDPMDESWVSPTGVTTTRPLVPVVQGAASNVWSYWNFSTTRTTWGNLSLAQGPWFFNNSVATEDSGAGVTNAQNITPLADGLFGAIVAPPYTVWANGVANPTADAQTMPAAANADGFITIKLKDDQGQIQTRVFTNTVPQTDIPIINRWVSTQPWYLGTFTGNNGLAAVGWNTGALDAGTGMPYYPAGTYTVWTESTLSRMKDNYKLNGADYTGKTLSASGTVTLISDTVKIEANKESVVRSKPFSVTVTGRPLTTYWVWVKGTSSMTGGPDNQPPMAGLFQTAVYNDTPNRNLPFVPAPAYPLGQYQGENFAVNRVLYTPGNPALSDVATDPTIYNSTRYYVVVNTSSSGTRTVQFETTNWTKAQTYTIRVERDTSMPNQGTGPHVNPVAANRLYISDEVDVRVEKGAVTITAAGDQSYYIGEEIKFSGTNTESQTTFLFLTGPNLWPEGSRFYPAAPRLLDPRRGSGQPSRVIDGDPTTFVRRPVNADNTWDWKWGTANYALDAGTYTVFAVSGPKDALTLEDIAYGTVSIIIKKPFISATASQSTVAQGDNFFITGTAEGKPQSGIAIWIMGKNYAQRITESVKPDASFSREITRAITRAMDAGQYFVVAQHPMQNQVFDIDMCAAAPNKVCNMQQGTAVGGQEIFTLLGQGSLQGTDAAEALVQGINTANVDDTYTKLVFLVEVPSIRIDPIGDRHVGDKFTITATTNLAVDDEVIFEVVSSSFKPTQKTQSGEFSGASGTVKVTKGDTGLNKLSFDVDASTFKPDEYIVQARWILNTGTTGTALFNVLEGAAPTAVPTKVVTTAAATQAPTAAPTAPPTAAPTKTPTQPGFGALVALIGLGAVAFFVVRRH